MSLVLTKDMVGDALKTGIPTKVNESITPRFRVGQRVRARNLHPHGHTRLVGYAKGKTGTVEADLGVFMFPDTMAHGMIPGLQHCYNVSFTAEELWGRGADPKNTVQIGFWEDYLDVTTQEVTR